MTPGRPRILAVAIWAACFLTVLFLVGALINPWAIGLCVAAGRTLKLIR